MRLPHRPNTGELHETWQPRLWATIVALILLAAYVIAFIVENDKPTRIRFVFGTTNATLIWVILLSFAIGILGGLLLSQLYRRRWRRGHRAG